ncbi:MAG: hypothetical protein LDLANPLL_01026 [Turneriella sp.]|nr:hypothetical protein [Turneriella sp.]
MRWNFWKRYQGSTVRPPWYFILFLGVVFFFSAFSLLRVKINTTFFPYHADFTLHNSDPGRAEGVWREKLTKYIFLVVIDGINEESIKYMPFLSSLKKNAAYFSAHAPFPSLSRTGYATLLTGAPPDVTGISAEEKSVLDSRIDSLPNQLQYAGWKTAFVGSSRWLEFFDTVFDLAAVDSSYNTGDAIFKEEISLNSGTTKGREILWHGTYQDTPDGWRYFTKRFGLQNIYGDDIATSKSEDGIRTSKALRMWKKEGADFLLLHLQTPLYAAKKSQGVQNGLYLNALRESDLNIERVLNAINFKTSTLVVTATHGYTPAFLGRGYGGGEAPSRTVPLFFKGASFKEGNFGYAELSDAVATLTALSGAAFPRHNSGKILDSALNLDEETINPAKFRLRQQQQHYNRALHASQKKFIKLYAKEEKVRTLLALFFLLGIVFILWKCANFLRGMLFYLLCTGVTFGFYFLFFRTLMYPSAFLEWPAYYLLFGVNLFAGILVVLFTRWLSFKETIFHSVLFSGFISTATVLFVAWYAWIYYIDPTFLMVNIFFQIQAIAMFFVYTVDALYRIMLGRM